MLIRVQSVQSVVNKHKGKAKAKSKAKSKATIKKMKQKQYFMNYKNLSKQ